MSRDASKNLSRLYVPRDNLSRGESFALSDGQHHYLRNVMRAEAGTQLRLFNGRNGEWLAEVSEMSKKNALVTVLEKLREQHAAEDIWVLASPVKKEAFDFMIEKSAELGAARFFPILCDRTIVNRINLERLQATANDAAEQCERLDTMEVSDLGDLENLFESWSPSRKLIFCMERGDAPMLGAALAKLAPDTPLALLVGPEGGFTDAEMAFITRQPFAIPVSLGTRILKAETAVVAALAAMQAIGRG
ncbi:MAG TPA: 16S rRNA (uracil(1498)-N(3))-methyltransferase [Patescibacteria group bacterium]|nr:16S rRNA (uracil(1498)-N(3))-methyltransferase [Patescibacteria group bacterium]